MNFFLETCSSTHTIAKDLFENKNISFTLQELNIEEKEFKNLLSSEKDFFITSKKMTSGVTRKENIKWFSPKGNLYLTMIFFKKNLQANSEILNNFEIISTVSIIIFKFIKKFIKNLKIKWPNDIIVQDNIKNIDKKICGIMSENLKNVIIVSVAFNIFKFPKRTSNFPATSINNEKILNQKEKKILKDTKIISLKIFQKIRNSFSKIQDNKIYFQKILSFFLKNLYKLNKKLKIKYIHEEREIIEIFELISISSTGEMILKKNNKIITLNSCEILY